ncbi:MAG: outer membrane protein [Allorhizobium sp.]
MIKKILFSSVALMLASTGAFAADVVEAPPAPPVAEMAAPLFSWDGAYIGLHGGYGWGDGDFSNGVAATSDSFDGGRFGGFVGYNWGFGNGAIVGLEGDLNYDWNENDYGGVTVGTGLNGSARARVGYGMDRALLYAAGGWTATDFRVKGGGFDQSETLNGWTLGAGIDYAVTDRVFGRLEYRYNDYGNKNILGVDTDFNQHVVQVGLGVKF